MTRILVTKILNLATLLQVGSAANSKAEAFNRITIGMPGIITGIFVQIPPNLVTGYSNFVQISPDLVTEKKTKHNLVTFVSGETNLLTGTTATTLPTVRPEAVRVITIINPMEITGVDSGVAKNKEVRHVLSTCLGKIPRG